jgi:hypothetical protein
VWNLKNAVDMTLYSPADYYRRFGNLLSQATRCSKHPQKTVIFAVTSVRTPDLSSLSTRSVYVFCMILEISDYFPKQR